METHPYLDPALPPDADGVRTVWTQGPGTNPVLDPAPLEHSLVRQAAVRPGGRLSAPWTGGSPAILSAEPETPAAPAPEPPESQDPWKVLIVDDHAVARQGTRQILEQFVDSVEIVGEAQSGEDAVAATADLGATLVIMDFRLPGMDGIEATRRIVERSPRARVVLFSAWDDARIIVEAIRAGAAGYLPKSSPVEEIRGFFNSLRHDGIHLLPSTAADVFRAFENGDPTEQRKDADLRGITPREREVLALLGEGLTARQMARRLNVSERTVNTHVGHIYQRLGVANRVEAVRKAIKLGLAEN